MSEGVLFEGHYKRDFFSKVRNALLRKMLYAKSARHLLANNQKVVFAFDYITNEIAIDGIYEIDDLNILIDWLAQTPDILEGECIDAGANIGNHSLFFSKFFSRVFSFEPNPKTFKVLSINAESVNNIDCFEFGLSSSTHFATLNCINGNVGGSHVVRSQISNGSKVSVPIKLTTLDSFYENFKNIKLIKYDVEGFEYDAILGSKKIILNFRPIVLFEQNRDEFTNGGSEVISLLRSFGYTKFAVIKKRSAVAKVPIVGFILRILKGSSRLIVLQNDFKPDFYPFIIAMP